MVEGLGITRRIGTAIHDIDMGPVESHKSQNNLPGTLRTSEKHITQGSVEGIAQVEEAQVTRKITVEVTVERSR